ncbi:ATP-binding cassette domain-containing protein [Oceanirhabdus seepicola]|uniref:ATP-binding cassette domain-containing protein n=1 Tax=Oceanirhabdus seepicola TaxID=2828781 RepID=A0A9J6P6I0_9CLOT|nr:ATP-binding cassette domain-containing protein [Oceanirhabdus seepicola]MCM1991405.1 ATP-binding cassette domain-containing protein [Oceanirhabdus seepicola]
MSKGRRMSNSKIFLKLIKYTWRASPLTFSALIVASLLFSVLRYSEIVVLQSLFSNILEVVKGSPYDIMIKPILAILIILILNPVGEWLEFLAQGYFWRRGNGYMQSLYHDRINRMDLIDYEDVENFDDFKKASLGNGEAPNGIRVIVQILFLYIPFILITSLYMISIKPMLVFAIVLIFIPVLISELIKMSNNYDFEDKIANRRRKTEYFESCIVSKENFKETLINGAFNYFYSLFVDSNKEFSKAYVHVKNKLLKVAIVMRIINTLGYLCVLALLVYYLYNGSISVSQFGAIYYSIEKITSMLKGLIEDIGEALVGISSTSFLIRFLNEEKEIEREEELSKADDIELRDVSFKYPNAKEKSLSNINLRIKKGTSLAIVGENGSGKSTLTKIIMGLYNPSQGVVQYGDKNIINYSNSSKFSNISAVFQNFIKYKLPAEDNIKISNISSQDSIENASSGINLSFNDLKINNETILSREFGGQELSGGEWQRIAIARGLYRPHDLIVLDEPTAAIDPIEEANVFSTFKKLSDDKTCIFVTHRLGSTQIADKIVVMENGEIVEEGTNQELIDLKGKYYHLLESQAKWYER